VSMLLRSSSCALRRFALAIRGALRVLTVCSGVCCFTLAACGGGATQRRDDADAGRGSAGDGPYGRVRATSRSTTANEPGETSQAGTSGSNSDITSESAAGAPDASGEDAGSDLTSEPATDSTTTQSSTTTSSATADQTYPSTLADTGLYADTAAQTLASSIEAYEPAFQFWSDGAEKKRFIALPTGTQIDTSDMDAWKFPVGTKVWKEFTRDGVRVETRFLHKRADRWFKLTYVWNAQQTEAVAVEDGVQNANGTQHDIPNTSDCGACHDGSADTLLGVSAIQLSHDKPGLNLTQLRASGRLTHPPSGDYVLPGDDVARAALSALHVNCGTCHNPRGAGLDRAKDLNLLLTVGALGSVEDTTIYQTTVWKSVQSKALPNDVTALIVPGDPDRSGLVLRQSAARTDELTMPPLASELPDEATTAALRAWILTL